MFEPRSETLKETYGMLFRLSHLSTEYLHHISVQPPRNHSRHGSGT